MSAVNWPEVGSVIPEDPLSEVSGGVSGGVTSLGGSEVMSVSLVVSSVVSSVVSMTVELSGGDKSLVSVILADGDKSVEFDTAVELVWSVQL